SWLGAFAMILTVLRLPQAAERRVRDFSRAALRRALTGVGPLAWFGLVPGVGAMMELAGFSTLMVLSTRLGNEAAAAFQAVLSIAALMLSVVGAFLVFDGLQYVFGAALRSLGEQVWAGVNGIFGFFLTTGGLGLLFVHTGWGAEGLALAAGLGMLASALLQFGRFWWVLRRSGRS